MLHFYRKFYSSVIMPLAFLMYLSIMFMFKGNVIWLVVTTMPLLSIWIKSAVTLDLMDLRSLLMLKMCSFAHLEMMSMLSWLMGIMTYFLEGPLVVMLILGLGLPLLYILIIFSFNSLENISFILRMSIALPFVACTKDVILLWCLDLARVLVLGLEGIGRRILEMLAGFSWLGFTDAFGMSFLLKLAATHYQKVLDFSLASSLSQPEL